jgi:hypothetical protein
VGAGVGFTSGTRSGTARPDVLFLPAYTTVTVPAAATAPHTTATLRLIRLKLVLDMGRSSVVGASGMIDSPPIPVSEPEDEL